MLPATMLPEILLGISAHPPFERVGIRGNDGVHIGLTVAGPRHRYVLEVHCVLTIGLPNRSGEYQRCVKAKCEHCRTARRLGPSPKEWNPGGRKSNGALVEEEASHSPLAHDAGNPANGLGIMDDRHAELAARFREIAIEERILHPSGNHVDPAAARGNERAAKLPVAEMARDDHRASASRDGALEYVQALHAVEESEQYVARVGRQERCFDARSSKVAIRLAGDSQYFWFGESGECGANLSLHDVATYAEGAICEPAKPLTDSSCSFEAEPAHYTDDTPQCVVLRIVRECRSCHRAAQSDLSPPAFAAAANPSIIVSSRKSRCARV